MFIQRSDDINGMILPGLKCMPLHIHNWWLCNHMSMGNVSSYSVKWISLHLIPHQEYWYPLYIFGLVNAIMRDTTISLIMSNCFHPIRQLSTVSSDKQFNWLIICCTKSVHILNYIKFNVFSFHLAYSHSSIPFQYNIGNMKHM